jgi:diguanylate cyclase (GGDEF)-like protein
VENIASDTKWEGYHDLARRAGVAACWSYPIVTSKKQVLGTFAIYARTPSIPDRNAGQLIETTSHLIALAIDSKRYEDRIQYLAHFDSLTSLPNRAQLQEQAQHLLPRADRSGTSVALLFIDIDRFMHVNDSFGHGVGDALLAMLADRLQHAVRDDDTLARFGGDEFVVMLPDTDAHGATVVAQKLIDIVKQPMRIDQFDMSVTASIGIALYPGDAKSFDELLKQADSAMHRAKRDNGSGFRFYSGEMQALSMRYLKVEAALRAGLERRQLFLQYQPQIDLRSGRVTGAEALMRFHHPDLGVVSPDEFIRVAEETGLIQSIGEWALREAVRQTRAWLDAGLPLKTIAVNLSAVQFHHEGLAQMIADVLEEAGLPPECLELELTESTAMRDPQAAIALMRELHERGIRLAIDDFGTGYSSLSCLKRFQLSKLKIDKSFVHDIDVDPDDRAIVSAVINVARELGISTIAEGVETEEQLRFLVASGCGAVQGFLFSRPLMADDFEAYCRSSLREPATVG